MHAAGIVPGLLSNISPDDNPPQIVVAALRALSNITDAAALAAISSSLDHAALAEMLFTRENIESLAALLALPSTTHLCQTQISLSAELIGALCTEDRHRHDLTMAGILDALASRLASFAVAQGYVVPGAEVLASSDGLIKAFPDAAPNNAKMEPVLLAIASIIGDSKHRAHRLAYSPAIMAVFPSLRFRPTKAVQDLRQGNEYSGSAPMSLQEDSTAMEYMLPVLPIRSTRTPQQPKYYSYSSPERIDPQLSQSKSRLTATTMWDSLRTHRLGHAAEESQDVESPLIPWLIYLVRRRSDSERVSAAAILTALFKAGLSPLQTREASLALLVVPILVGLIARHEKDTPSDTNEAESRLVLQRAPAVLAHLIADSEVLQKAAYDCDAVGVLTNLLKRAYTPVDPSAAAMWSPHSDTQMDEDEAPVATMGQAGENPLQVHYLELRASSLMAVAALAGQEEHRKALVREDLVLYVVESLAEFPKRPQPPKEKPTEGRSRTIAESITPGYGRNTVKVIVAACHVTRMLSRSVSILRTALVDNAVALPILKFMEHPDVRVQIAATATMCNLVLEVSPVREVRIFCYHERTEQANSHSATNRVWGYEPSLSFRTLEQSRLEDQRILGIEAFR